MAEAKRSRTDDELTELLDLYERYGRPLEASHWGQFLAVSADGATMLDTDYGSLFSRAAKAYGEDIAFFRIGEIAAGSARWSRL